MDTDKFDVREAYGVTPFAPMKIDRVFAHSVVVQLSVWFEEAEYSAILETPTPLVKLGPTKQAYQNGVALAQCQIGTNHTDPDTYPILGVAREFYTAVGKTVAVVKLVVAGAVMCTDARNEMMLVSNRTGGWRQHKL